MNNAVNGKTMKILKNRIDVRQRERLLKMGIKTSLYVTKSI